MADVKHLNLTLQMKLWNFNEIRISFKSNNVVRRMLVQDDARCWSGTGRRYEIWSQLVHMIATKFQLRYRCFRCQTTRLDWSEHSRWNFAAISHTSWDMWYFISTSGYSPPCLSSHSPRQTSVFRSIQLCCLTSTTYRYSRRNFVAIV